MKRQRHPLAARGELPGKLPVNDMDGDAARPVAQRAFGICFPLHRWGHVTVFDHDDLAVLQTEVPDLLLRISLGHHLARHLGMGGEVESDKSRVNATHDGIIHLEVADRVDALGLHQVECPAALQRAQRATMAIGA